jgi:hypothetical protein
MHLQLFINPLDMRPNGLNGDTAFIGYHFITMASHQEIEYSLLAGSELVIVFMARSSFLENDPAPCGQWKMS